MSSVLRSGRIALGLAGRGAQVSGPARRYAPPATIRSLINTHIVRNSGDGAWCYREAPKAPMWSKIGAELTMGVFWWWVFWHVWHEPDLLLGTEYERIRPETWTDEELGIPPDEEGIGGRLPNYVV